jgi:hypothetical protein
MSFGCSESAHGGGAILEFSWTTEALRDLCNKSQFAVEQLGQHVAATLHRYLSDLDAMDFVSELIEMYPEKILILSNGQIEIEIGVRQFLVIRAGGAKPARLDENGIPDWTRVSRVHILKIGGRE